MDTTGRSVPADKGAVSVVIPTYNDSQFIGEALNSALAQTRLASEIVVVNDCSTDPTLNVVQQYVSQYPDLVRVLNTERNSGAGAARNLGIQAARGDLIAFLDADDYWKDIHLETVTGLLERFPEADWAFSEMAYLRPDGRVEPYTCGGSIPENEPFNGFYQCCWFSRSHVPCVVIRKAVFDDVGYFATEYRLAEDFDFFMRVSKDHIVVHSPVVTGFIRQHATSATGAAPMKYDLQTISIRHEYLQKHRHELSPEQISRLNHVNEQTWLEQVSLAFYTERYDVVRGYLDRRKYLPDPKIARPWMLRYRLRRSRRIWKVVRPLLPLPRARERC